MSLSGGKMSFTGGKMSFTGVRMSCTGDTEFHVKDRGLTKKT